MIGVRQWDRDRSLSGLTMNDPLPKFNWSTLDFFQADADELWVEVTVSNLVNHLITPCKPMQQAAHNMRLS